MWHRLSVKPSNVMQIQSLTCNIDIDCREGSQGNSCHVLRPHTQWEVRRCLVVEWLWHQDRCRAVLTVWGEVEPYWHVGFRDHPVLQVVGHPWVAQMRGGFDCLSRMGSEIITLLSLEPGCHVLLTLGVLMLRSIRQTFLPLAGKKK